LFGKRLHVEVSVCLEPKFMDLNGKGPDQARATLRIGKDADDVGTALELLVEPFQHVGAFQVLVMFLGKR
jgi:hypothetical protein